MMRKICTLTWLFLGLTISLFGQIEDPVEWEFSKTHIDGNRWELVFTAYIESGWSVYSQHLDDGGPVPTSINFNSTMGFQILGDATESGREERGYDKIFEMDVVKYHDELILTQEIEVDPDTREISGFVEYMTCDETRCLPPTPVDFTFRFDPASDGSSTDGGMKLTDEPKKKDEGLTFGSVDLSGFESAEGADGASDEMARPVTWTARVENFNGDDQKATLVFEGMIDKGWHVYSSAMDDDAGPIPLGIVPDAGQENYIFSDLREEAIESVESYDEIFEVDVTKVKQGFSLLQEIQFDEESEPLEGSIEYMACTAENCIFPPSLRFSFDPASGTIVLIDPDAVQPEMRATDSEIAAGLMAYYDLDPDALGQQEAINCVAEEDNHTIIQGSGNTRIFILGFLGGLLALLTPCVFPMIPLTVSFFTKSGENKSGGIGRSVLYGGSILAIYLLFSIPFHFLDSINPDILNNISTNVGLNIFFFLIFLFFAFSFFGYYELTLPSSWANKVSKAEGLGGFIGIFFMALTLALVSFSCTGPILGSLLAGSLSSDGGATQLTLGMGGFGLALALPFTFFAAFPTFMNKLPRSGSWLNTVKVVMGFLELGLAFKFLSNADLVEHWGLLKIEPFLIIWTVIAIGLGLYLFGLIRFPHDSKNQRISLSRKALGVLSLAFAVYLLSGFRYNEETRTFTSLTLLSGLAPPVGYSWIHPNDCPNNISCFKDLNEGLAYARKFNLPVMLDFTGYACVNCRKMEEHIWPNSGIKQIMEEDFVLISLYVDDRTELPESEQVSLPKHTGGERTLRTVGDKWHFFQTEFFRNNSQPLYALVGPDGRLLNQPVGYTPSVEDFRDFLECGLDVFREQSESIGARMDQ